MKHRSCAGTDSAANLVSRAVRFPAPAFRAALASAALPWTVWDAPDEATVVGSGAAATITAAGPDRFDRVREAARDLFGAGDVRRRRRRLAVRPEPTDVIGRATKGGR